MAATAQPNIGTKEGFAAGDNGWVGDYNFLNRAVDGLVQASVKAIQAAPPGSPARGDCYIVATSGTGAWAGWDGRFVRYTGSVWESWIPKAGWYVFNQADSTPYRYKSGAWVVDDFLPKNNPTATGTLTADKMILALDGDNGIRFYDSTRIYKATGSGLIFRSNSGNARPQFEDSSGNRSTIWDAGNLVGTRNEHNHSGLYALAPSRATISASTSLGGISASAIYIPTTDVNLTLDGGVDGQAWDIYSAASVGLIVPSGTSLYAYNGIDRGPTTRPVGGGRAIRVVRLTATTWLVPNMSW